MNRINLICLGVSDLKKARAFYRDGLGFTTPNNEEEPDVVFFNNAGTKLELFPLEGLAKDISETNPPAGKGFGGITLAYTAKSRDEVDEVFRKIVSIGGTIVKPPQTVFWGGYSGYFQDLDGYYWEVAYADFWKYDETDMLVIS